MSVEKVCVIRMTDESIAARRKELKAMTRWSVEELRNRSKDYLLDQHEQAVLRELDDLDFLSGGVLSGEE